MMGRITMNMINVAVIGAGHLGRFHIAKYNQLPECNLVAICETDTKQAKSIAEQYSVAVVENYQTLVGKVDAVTIATPTHTHYAIASFFLMHGIHVLLEKPIATTLVEANKLVKLAKQYNRILQIGHLERFNSVIQQAKTVLTNPLFVESVRIAPFKPRSMDVNVVLDIMIHDIDIIQYLMPSNITHIVANGAPVATSHIDIVNARLDFANGAVANVTASRVSLKSQRIFRIFQKNAYISLDLHQKRLSIHQKGETEMFPGIPEIVCDEIDCPSNDALKDQAVAFLNSIRTNTPPKVSAQQGCDALQYALQITDILNAHNKKYSEYWKTRSKFELKAFSLDGEHADAVLKNIEGLLTAIQASKKRKRKWTTFKTLIMSNCNVFIFK